MARKKERQVRRRACFARTQVFCPLGLLCFDFTTKYLKKYVSKQKNLKHSDLYLKSQESDVNHLSAVSLCPSYQVSVKLAISVI